MTISQNIEPDLFVASASKNTSENFCSGIQNEYVTQSIMPQILGNPKNGCNPGIIGRDRSEHKSIYYP